MQVPPDANSSSSRLKVAVALAPSIPGLLAFNLPPSPTLLNQCLAVALWGSVVWSLGAMSSTATAMQEARSLLAAAGVLVFGVLMSLAVGSLPAAIAVSTLLMLVVSALLVFAGSDLGRRADPTAAFSWFLLGMVGVGLLSAFIALIQVFAPELPDGQWIARSGIPGRAVGNLRQPNHLSSLLMWSYLALVALLELRRSNWVLGAAIGVLLMFALVLSGSRTGALGTLLLAGWGMLDRKLSRRTRALLLGTPLLYAMAWATLSAVSHLSGLMFGAENRLSPPTGSDISSSRFAIWSNTLAMIVREPWTGVGYGEFNLAWTLSALPDRPVAFFDHTHNLPLQLLVELGLPLGLIVLALLAVALAQAGRRAWHARGEVGIQKRTAFMLVLMIGLHSLLEYPLWYAYFLLPAVFAWGYALAVPWPDDESRTAVLASGHRSWPVAAIGLTVTLGAAAAVLDYSQVALIYEPPANAAPLEDRIARGQRSPLFAHHADYAAATAFGEPKAPLSASQALAFQRAPHHLLDVRLMIAWAQALAEQGDVDKARWLAARIREFRNPASDEFFEPCTQPAPVLQAFQCQAPLRGYFWREFVQR